MFDSIPNSVMDYLDPRSQITAYQASAIVKILNNSDLTANILVFGVGFDSGLWRHLGRNGKVIFVEQNQNWIRQVEHLNKGIHIIHYPYESITVEKSLSITKPNLSSYAIPKELLQHDWDLIVIDAPEGWSLSSPGRAIPIFWSQKLAKKGCIVVVDDADRELEQRYSHDLFPEDEYIKEKVGRSESLTNHMLIISHRQRVGRGDSIEPT